MAYDDYDYVDMGEEEWLERRPRDVKIDEAKGELAAFFGERAEEVFYLKQLEVFFEKKFYHWITAKGVNELLDEGFLGKEELPLGAGAKVKFVFNKKHRYYRRQISKCMEVISEFAAPTVAIACGRQAEVLFLNAFAKRGFVCKGQNTNEYSVKKWTKTDHDLDFIIERDGLTYGSEVKNRWDYIAKSEYEVKIEICSYLGVKPLFVMRNSPTVYNWQIIRRGGYAMIFETQIYPFGQEVLVRKIREVLGLPVDCPRAIPDGIIDRFIRWHGKIARV